MKAALYARVSSDMQVERDNSIPAQLRMLRAYCVQNSISIYEEYIDEAITGQKENRPAFQKMLTAAAKGCFDIVLVHKFDRFARKIELSRKIKTQLKDSNINVISITEPIEDSPMGFFMEGLYELMAEYYVKNLAQETKKGMNERALKGKHMGQMPYGYYCKDGNAYVNEEQAEIVRKVFDLYLSGWGQVKIAKWLNENQIPMYSGGIGRWQSFQVQSMLKNYKYIGKNYWGGQFYAAEFPSILSEEMFNEVILVMDKKRIQFAHDYRGSNFDKFRFLEILHCGECGSPMRIKVNKEWNGTKTYKYTCRNASMYRKDCKSTKLYPSAQMENDIDEYLKKVMNGSLAELNIIEDRPVNATDVSDKQIKRINNELERAKQAYIEGVFELLEYRDLKNKLEEKRNAAEASISKAEYPSYDEKREALLNSMNDVWALYESLTDANEQRKILRKFIKRIDVFKDKIGIVFFI